MITHEKDVLTSMISEALDGQIDVPPVLDKLLNGLLQASKDYSGDVNPITGEFIATTLKETIFTFEGGDAPYTWDVETE